MTRFEAIEVTAHQAWFLADYLSAGSFPWKLAVTAPYFEPAERESFHEQALAELTTSGVIDSEGTVKPSAAHSIRTICRSSHWLEWVTMVDPDQILRGVLARGPGAAAVVALRYAQMITFTPMQLAHSEAVVPIISAGLPADVQPAQFSEFELSIDVGTAIDGRIARGAHVAETLIDLGVPEHTADIMEIAYTGDRITVEVTAHEATNGARHQTDVGVSLISTEIGLILVSPTPGQSRAGATSVFAPGEPFAIAMAVRDLTGRLPSGPWFPDENYDF